MDTPWYILGAGAIGGLFAARLHALGQRAILLNRHGATNKEHLTFIDGDQSWAIEFEQQPTEHPAPIKRLLVTTKSFDAQDAVRGIAHRLLPEADVVVMCNGMGYHHPIKDLIHPARLIAATTTAGCSRPKPQLRVLAGHGETRFGYLDTCEARPPPSWFQMLSDAQWHCEWDTNIEMALLRKVAINAVINPATALHNITNGALLSPEFIGITQSAIAEVGQLLTWAGHGPLAESLPALIEQVARSTADNVSSMRADVLAQRKTEINEILGYLLHQLPAADEAAGSQPDTPLLTKWFSDLQQTA